MFPMVERPARKAGGLDLGTGVCPCGEPAAFGQIWATEWYDSTGLVEKYIILTLCAAHKARRHGED